VVSDPTVMTKTPNPVYLLLNFELDSGGPLMITMSSISNPGFQYMMQVGIVSAGTYIVIKDPVVDGKPIVWYTSVQGLLHHIIHISCTNHIESHLSLVRKCTT
jgi:hypothetical protein